MDILGRIQRHAAYKMHVRHVPLLFSTIIELRKSLPRTGFDRRHDSGRGFAEPGGLDGHVRLHVGEFHDGLAVGPGHNRAERQLHSGDLTIIGIVNLNGNRADRGVAVAQLSDEKSLSLSKNNLIRERPAAVPWMIVTSLSSTVVVGKPVRQSVSACLIPPGNQRSASIRAASNSAPGNSGSSRTGLSTEAIQPSRPAKVRVLSPFCVCAIVVNCLGAFA